MLDKIKHTSNNVIINNASDRLLFTMETLENLVNYPDIRDAGCFHNFFFNFQ